MEFNKVRTVTGAEECMKTNAPLALSLSLTTKRSLMQAGFVHYLFAFIYFVYFYLSMTFSLQILFYTRFSLLGMLSFVVACCGGGGCVCRCCWRCDCVIWFGGNDGYKNTDLRTAHKLSTKKIDQGGKRERERVTEYH